MFFFSLAMFHNSCVSHYQSVNFDAWICLIQKINIDSSVWQFQPIPRARVNWNPAPMKVEKWATSLKTHKHKPAVRYRPLWALVPPVCLSHSLLHRQMNMIAEEIFLRNHTFVSKVVHFAWSMSENNINSITTSWETYNHLCLLSIKVKHDSHSTYNYHQLPMYAAISNSTANMTFSQ